MPKEELKSISIIGQPYNHWSGLRFDYSGSQALRSLREDGIETILYQ